jgi:hypothetical protein
MTNPTNPSERCWNCGSSIRYHENGIAHYHCECGAVYNPTEPVRYGPSEHNPPKKEGRNFADLSPKDYPASEDGIYQRTCVVCQSTFFGPKGPSICKECADKFKAAHAAELKAHALGFLKHCTGPIYDHRLAKELYTEYLNQK